MSDNRKKDDELEKLYGSNKTSTNNEEKDKKEDSDVEKKPEDVQDEIPPQDEYENLNEYEEKMYNRAQENFLKYCESREKRKKSRFVMALVIGIFSLILSFTVGVLVGVFSKTINIDRIKIPIVEEKMPEKYQVLDEIEKIITTKYYKELSEYDLFLAYLAAIGQLTDRYTGFPKDFSFSIPLNSDGGYGITIAYYEDKEKNIKGLKLKDISTGLLAEEDLLKDPLNSLVPGDIIVGFLDPIKNKPFFFDNLAINNLDIIKIDKDNVPERTLYVYNPLRDGDFNKDEIATKGKKVIMRYKDYPKYRNDLVMYKPFKKGSITYNGVNLDKNIAYLRVLYFHDDIVLKLGEAISEIDKFLVNEKDELVIDLRGNPGGDLRALKSFLAYFIPEKVEVNGEKIHVPLFVMAPNAVKKEEKPLEYDDFNNQVYRSNEIYRKDIDGLKEELKYKQTESFKKYPIKILVNGDSASASELFASVMKEQVPTATVYGEPTYGKDIYQVTESLKTPNKLVFNIKYTAGKWGYYKKGETEPTKYSLITKKGSEIITKDSPNYIISRTNQLEYLRPFITRNLKIDTVSNDNIWLSKFLQRVIYDNIENEIFTKYQEHKEKLEKEEYLRTDGYFDKNIEDALVLVKKFLKITSNDDISYMKEKEYNYLTYSYFYIYYQKNAKLYDQFNFLNFNKAITDKKDDQLLNVFFK